MKLTNATPARRALMDILEALNATGQPLENCAVGYTDPGQDATAESVWLGAVVARNDGDHDARREFATVPLYIRVSQPDATPEDNDLRAEAIGQAIHNQIEAQRQPLGPNTDWAVTGLSWLATRTTEDSIADLQLTIEVRSYL